MKNIIHLFLVFFVLFYLNGIAQVPTFFNTNTTAGANTFPLGNTGASRRVQWFIPPNSLGAVTVGNNITDVYFQTGSTGTWTYPILNVKLKVGSGTGLTSFGGGPIEPGMITVYSAVNQVVNATTGGWIKFTLNTPFSYNPALPLIVELEHNSTSGGPTVYQAVSIPGPGNGRQWGDYNVGNLTGVGTQQINFGVDVFPATPCTGAPGPNSVISPTFQICPGASQLLSLANPYLFGGISYQWQSSPTSSVGPWASIPNATLSSYTSPNFSATTYYQAIITCSNSNQSTTSAPGQLNIAGTSTSSIPFVEGFENLSFNNQLPNCSWASSSTGTICQTYTSPANANRNARTGNKFAAFNTSSGSFFTNGIQLNTGITYSSSVWYKTDVSGAFLNWSNLSISIGNTQSPVGQVTVASTSGPVVSPSYVPLSNTFTVSSSGLYYFGISATSTASGAPYLVWDDFEIIAPCQLNPSSLSISSPVSTICAGQPVILSVTGNANSYTWNNGATGSSINVSPVINTTYVVTGTSSLTGCLNSASKFISVNPSPIISIISISQSVCIGSSVSMLANGANTYLWSNGATSQALVVSPNVSSTYSVYGSNSFGCSASASQFINAIPLPVIIANSIPSSICRGEVATLVGSGASTYTWISNSNYLNGGQVNVSPNSSTTYTVSGTNNGCSSSAFVSLVVSPCVGINSSINNDNTIYVYPNPSSSDLTIELANNARFDVEIIDLTGRVVLEKLKNEKKQLINIGFLSNGIYYVKTKSDDFVKIIKLIKN